MSTTFRLRRVLFFISIAVFMCALDAQARLANESDLAAVTEFERAVYDVRADGTYTMMYEARVSILTEAGRESQAVKSIGFNGRASKFELLEVNTINDGVKIPVSASGIQIKEVGESKVFDS